MAENVHDEPSDVTADSGVALIDGPDGVAFDFTLEAAEVISDRLLFAAGQAKSQQIAAGKRRPGTG